jgi:hypothetical protein
MWTYLRARLTIWVILAALGLAGVLLVILYALVVILPGGMAQKPTPTVSLILIPAPTVTKPISTATQAAGLDSTPAAVDGIVVGMFVQISGTGGDGLRLRSGAGRENAPRFLGYEAEVFRVKEGPAFADGLTWWFLEAPYDPERSGWAAADYLAVVTPPQ